MSLTRKHFIEAADNFGIRLRQHFYSAEAREAVADCVSDFCRLAKQSNSNFDRSKFVSAILKRADLPADTAAEFERMVK